MRDTIRQIGNVMSDMSAWNNPSVGRVYDKRYLAPTINTCSGGGKQPHIVVEVEDDKEVCSTTARSDRAWKAN